MKDLLLALGGPKAKKDPAVEVDESLTDAPDSEGQTASAQDILDAMNSGDAEALSAALNAFIDLR